MATKTKRNGKGKIPVPPNTPEATMPEQPIPPEEALYLCNVALAPSGTEDLDQYERSLRAAIDPISATWCEAGYLRVPQRPRRLRREMRNIPKQTESSSEAASSSASAYSSNLSRASAGPHSAGSSVADPSSARSSSSQYSAASRLSSRKSPSRQSSPNPLPPLSPVERFTPVTSPLQPVTSISTGSTNSTSGNLTGSTTLNATSGSSSSTLPDLPTEVLHLTERSAEISSLISRLELQKRRNRLTGTIRSLRCFIARITELAERDAAFVTSEAAGVINEDLKAMIENFTVVAEKGRGATRLDASVAVLWRWDGVLPGVWKPPAPLNKRGKMRRFLAFFSFKK